MYVDRAASDRRASSFIVSGMPPSSGRDDSSLVADLCQNAIGIRPDVTAAKRLGKPRPDRAQPILVYLKSSDHAKAIISQAKKLRQSTDLFVKNNVYINANLTQAEAKAAYEVRCRRRQSAHANSNGNGGQLQPSPGVGAPHVPLALHGPVIASGHNNNPS